jgi:hypothetical protein
MCKNCQQIRTRDNPDQSLTFNYRGSLNAAIGEQLDQYPDPVFRSDDPQICRHDIFRRDSSVGWIK